MVVVLVVVVVVVVVVDVDVVVVGSSFKNQEQKRTVLAALETGQYRALCKHPANGINPERRSEDGRQTKLGATLHPLACKPAPQKPCLHEPCCTFKLQFTPC